MELDFSEVGMSKLDKNLKIAVIAGGMSDEREVSLQTGRMMYDALVKEGYANVSFVDVDFTLDQKLREIKPDVVVNGLHGKYGEDGTVQGLLEMMKIPYTNSGVAASAVGMNKILCRAVMEECGIRTAPGKTVVFTEDLPAPFDYPFVIKDPVNGSSCGVYIVKSDEEWSSVKPELKVGKVYLCEKFFKGRDIDVAVLDNKHLGNVAILPTNEFYDYDAKYNSDSTVYIVDPELDPGVRAEIESAAVKLHNAIGCKGVTRSDFLVDGKDYVMLEINTLPGMTGHSLVPMIAKKRGISYIELLEMLIAEALG